MIRNGTRSRVFGFPHGEAKMRKNPFPVHSHWLGRSAMVFAMLFVFGPWIPDAGAGTDPKLGGGGTVATGSAGGAESQGASSQLEKCDESLGTMAVVEDQSAPVHTFPVQTGFDRALRMMVQQSILRGGRGAVQADAPGQDPRISPGDGEVLGHHNVRQAASGRRRAARSSFFGIVGGRGAAGRTPRPSC